MHGFRIGTLLLSSASIAKGIKASVVIASLHYYTLQIEILKIHIDIKY